MDDKFHDYFYNIFLEWGLSDTLSKYLNLFILIAILLVILVVATIALRKLIIKAFNGFAKRTSTNFDDLLVQHKVPKYIARIIPFLIAFKLFPLTFRDFPQFEGGLMLLLKLYGVLLLMWIIRSILKTIGSYFKTVPSLQDKPIDSYIQVVMLFLWIIGAAFFIVLLTGISLFKFFTTIGAASAILLLIFRDTILGFVASIQVAINDTVRIGDWITMEKYGADGDVISINLSTVQVQNFDKTITNIPTYSLISDSFKNWRGMSNSGGRRIKRSIIIKASSVRYLTSDEIEKLGKIQLINKYLDTRKTQIDTFNKDNNIDKSLLINGRNLTNFGVFRKYLQTYIESQSAINKDMTIMTRQLAPTSQGVPLEIYAFSSDQRWENYEYIMSDIFDHCLAAVPYFYLKLFELDFSKEQEG